MTEENKTCTYQGCQRSLYDHKYCIFHSEDIEAKNEKFGIEFLREYGKQNQADNPINFDGFVFPPEQSFAHFDFEKNVSFQMATFTDSTSFNHVKFAGDTIFADTVFKGGVDFGNAIFRGEAIFHSVKFRKVVDFSNAKFKGEASFMEVQFFELPSFERVEFSKRANFSGALFYGGASFSKSVFWGSADFIQVEFSELTVFSNSNFNENAIFSGSTFNGSSFFSEIKFSGWTEFREVIFGGRADFSRSHFFEFVIFDESEFSYKADFTYTEFSGRAVFGRIRFNGAVTFAYSRFLVDVNFSRSEFYNRADFIHSRFLGLASFEESIFANISDLYMLNSYFCDVSGLLEILSKDKKIRTHQGKSKTEFLSDNIRIVIGEISAVRYPIINRQIQDDWFLIRFREKHKTVHFLWWLLADCGRSIIRWGLWSICFAVLFALIFQIAGMDAFKQKSEGYTWFSFIYYSIVTFTTLGFGDITPVKWYSEILVTLEVILGYIMLGGLISILANKLARRG